MKKHFYATIALLALLVTGAFAQTELSITAYKPLAGDHYANFSDGDTMQIFAILKNEGPENLNNTDTIKVWLDLNWCLNIPNYVWYENYGATQLNSRLAGGIDTLDLSIWQGILGTATTGEDLIVTFPKDKIEDSIIIRCFGFTPDSLIRDAGVVFIDGSESEFPECTGNNIINPQGVVFGTPTNINRLELNKSTLAIYPNPSENQISFTNEFAMTKSAVVKITDITGRLVKIIDLGKQNAGTKIYNIDISTLNNGVYYIELLTDSTRSIAKFSKN